MRAIIASWKNTLPDLRHDEVWPIIQKLADKPPKYNLPDASVSHTRHYMKSSGYTKANGDVSLIIDTFVVTGDRPVEVIWDGTTLGADEILLLGKILKNLHYFGRAESWCDATVSNDACEHNCEPIGDAGTAENDIVRVLTANKDIQFVDMHGPGFDKSTNSLTVSTSVLHDKKYIDPPCGTWVKYWRPKNCFMQKTAVGAKSSTLTDITVVRYAIAGRVKPRIADALRVGDTARSACMSRYGKRKNGDVSTTFSGKDGKGKPLTNHMHAFYLPTYETQQRNLDHLTIIAFGKFDKDELDSMFSLRRIYRYNSFTANLSFQGCGTVENFADIPILGKSMTWVSSTPLVLSRHTKYRKNTARVVDGLEEQIRREVQNRYGPEYELEAIEQLQTDIRGTGLKTIDFFRWRRHGSMGDGTAYNLRLKFKSAVRGPITLGYAAHYGLGMFVPEGEE